MTTSGRDAHRSPEAITPTGSGPTWRPRTSSPDNQAALRLIGLAALIHMLRSPRFYQRMIVSAIVLAALARLGKENGASTFGRLAAWNKQQVQRLEHKAQRQARSLKGRAKGQQT